MSVSVKKDPKRRAGGWALIRLPDGAAGAAAVAIRRADTDEWLGAADWQGGRHDFGPYPIESGPNGPFLRVGPEIVDKMEAYTPFTLHADALGVEAVLVWPEGIPPSPEGSAGGGVGVVADKPNDLSGSFAGPTGAPPEPPKPAAPPPPPPSETPPETPRPAPPPQPPAPPPQPATPDQPRTAEPPVEPRRPDPDPAETVVEGGDPKKRRSLAPLLLLLALLVVGAGAAWWFLLGPGAQPAPPVVVEEEEPAPPAEPPAPPEPELACVREDVVEVVRAEAPDAADLWSMVELCRGAGDADLEVRVLERLAGMEDAAALREFALRYDPRDTGAPRSFGEPDAANAASYYKRAAEAGSTEAADDLTALCTHLRGEGGASAQMVLAIHCE